MAGLALLAGLFLIPAVALWLGRGIRFRSPRTKAAFWGGVFGHSLAAVAWLVAALLPPVAWPESGGRSLILFGVLLVGAVAGAALGAALAGRRSDG